MRIEHVALWARDIDRVKDFYERHFGAEAGPKYLNDRRKFSSYFLTFEGGARMEIMNLPVIGEGCGAATGYAHVAFNVGSREKVDSVTESLRDAGVSVVSEPRETGDGYYESVVLDPEGNLVEIVG